MLKDSLNNSVKARIYVPDMFIGNKGSSGEIIYMTNDRRGCRFCIGQSIRKQIWSATGTYDMRDILDMRESLRSHVWDKYSMYTKKEVRIVVCFDTFYNTILAKLCSIVLSSSSP